MSRYFLVVVLSILMLQLNSVQSQCSNANQSNQTTGFQSYPLSVSYNQQQPFRVRPIETRVTPDPNAVVVEERVAGKSPPQAVQPIYVQTQIRPSIQAPQPYPIGVHSIPASVRPISNGPINIPLYPAPMPMGPAQPLPAQQIPFPPVEPMIRPQPVSSFPAQQLPAQQFPAPQFPAQQFPAQQFPAQQFPAQQFPAQQFPALQFPAPHFPAQQFPAQQFPAHQFPAQQFPAQQFPAQQFPIQSGQQLPCSRLIQPNRGGCSQMQNSWCQSGGCETPPIPYKK